ncbi:hypothetical protein [Bradyrhizobium cytisi]|nr:hypothetical protein [Bradyrhizobium cytisi]
MRHPQRLDIKFLGTQIRAEGILGILGTIVIVAVVLSAYLRG